MWRIKVFIRSVFGFNRTETHGFLVLLPLSLCILFSEPLFRALTGPEDDLLDQKRQDSVMAYIHSRLTIPADSVHHAKSIVSLDPNTADESQLIHSGLKPYLAKRFLKYRQKGAKFNKREDLLKVYGMDTSWVHENHFLFPSAASVKAQKPTNLAGRRIRELMDINQADSQSILEVRGIGPARARRIMLFREKLGGFVKMEQLREIYGMDTTTFGELKKYYIVKEDFTPRRINLNTTDWEALARHPYVDSREATAILSYRTQHGRFDSIKQIYTIRLLKGERVEKLLPYLTID